MAAVPPQEGGSFPGFLPPEAVDQTPSQSSPLENMVEARQNGYAWPEIEGHLANIRTRANQFGYSSDDVSRAMGYSPEVLNTRLSQSVHNDFNASTEHPVTAATGGFIQPSTDPEQPYKVGALTPTQRYDYSQAVINGETRGPGHYADNFLDIAGDRSGADLSNLKFSLTSQLPTPQAAVDFGLGLAQDLTDPLVLTKPKDIERQKQAGVDAATNIMNIWGATGQTPATVYSEAQKDPLFKDIITSPLPKPPTPLTQSELTSLAQLDPALFSVVADRPPQKFTPDQQTYMEDLLQPGQPKPARMPTAEELNKPEEQNVMPELGAFVNRDSIRPVQVPIPGQELFEEKDIKSALIDMGVDVATAPLGFLVGKYVAMPVAKFVSEQSFKPLMAEGKALVQPAVQATKEAVTGAATTAKQAVEEKSRLVVGDKFTDAFKDLMRDTYGSHGPDQRPGGTYVALQQAARDMVLPLERLPLPNDPATGLPFPMTRQEMESVVTQHIGELEARGLKTKETYDGWQQHSDAGSGIAEHEFQARAHTYVDNRLLGTAQPATPAEPLKGTVTPVVGPERQIAEAEHSRIKVAGERAMLPGPKGTAVAAPEMPGNFRKPQPIDKEVEDYLAMVKPMTDDTTRLARENQEMLGERYGNDPKVARPIRSEEEGYVHRVNKAELADRPGTISPNAASGAGTQGITLKAPGLKARTGYQVFETPEGQRYFNVTDTDHDLGSYVKFQDGRYAQVREATQDEIEHHVPGTEYYRNHFINSLNNNAEVFQVNRTLHFLQDNAQRLVDQGSFIPDSMLARNSGLASQTRGMMHIDLPGMQGWVQKRFGYILNDNFKYNGDDPYQFLKNINTFLLNGLFLNPLPHELNVKSQWQVSRGLNWIPGSGGYIKGIPLMTRAYNDVTNLGPGYQEFVANGGAGMYGRVQLHNFQKVLFTKMMNEMALSPELWDRYARDQGFKGLSHMMNTMVGKSNEHLWQANDIMLYHRYLELREINGLSTKAAIYQAQKDIVSYAMPSQVLMENSAGRFLSNILKSPFFAFMRYRYGLVRSIGEMAKDFATGQSLPPYLQRAGEVGFSPTRTRLEAAARATVLGSQATGYWLPTMVYNKALQTLFNNPDIHSKPHGAAAPVAAIIGMGKGERTFGSVLNTFLQGSPAWETLNDLAHWRTAYNGKPITGSTAPPAVAATEAGEFAAGQYAPTRLVTDVLQGRWQGLADQIGLNINPPGTPSRGDALSEYYREKYDPMIQSVLNWTGEQMANRPPMGGGGGRPRSGASTGGGYSPRGGGHGRGTAKY